jgi:hydroxymethylbilane synthase
MLPAVGQGALAIEARADDKSTRAVLAALDDRASHLCVLAERTLLFELRAGCSAPVGAWARLENEQLALEAVVLSADGSRRLAARGIGDRMDAIAVGQRIAAELIAKGAADLIAASRP